MAHGDARRDVIVITGSGGMGVAIARRLGGGRHLVLADVSTDALSTVATTLRGEGHAVTAVPADISDRVEVTNLANTAAGLGTIRAMVHTAGVSPVQATADQIVQIDVVGTAFMLEVFADFVGPGAVGVVIASMAGTLTTLPADTEHLLATIPADELANLPALHTGNLDPGRAYGIAKRANQVRVQAASIAWGRVGARVVSISPGIISTPMGQQELGGPVGDIMRQMTGVSGCGRLGTPDDVAAVVEFLISPGGSFITGTDLLVDGGVTAALRFS